MGNNKRLGKQSAGINRRTFLITSSAVVGTLLVGLDPFSWFDSDNEWGFLEREISKPKLSLDDLLRMGYVPLHEEHQLPKDSERSSILTDIDQLIKEGIERQNPDLGENFTVHLTRQRYAVPEETPFSSQLLRYCKTAEGYLHRRLSGLRKANIDWTVIKVGDDYSHEKKYHQKGFVGKFLYDVIRGRVTSNENPSKNFTVVRTQGVHRSELAIDGTKEDPLKSWLIFINSGGGAIASPFSEIIPLTIFERMLKYEEQVGLDYALQSMEAVSEGISYVLSLDIVRELNIPNGIKHIKESSKYLTGIKYQDVPQAIAWIQKNGPQSALDLYQEHPQKFMDAIKA